MSKMNFKLMAVAGGLLFLGACNSSKNLPATDREDIKGNWTLSKVSYDGLSSGEKVKITLLDEGDDVCLTNSTWALPNNGYGSYTLTSTSAGCTPGQRNIIWSYQKSGSDAYFQYKLLPGGVKATQVKDGYKLKIVSSDKSSFVAQTETAFEGKSIFINYTFTKN